MAITNQERIGKGLDLLRPFLHFARGPAHFRAMLDGSWRLLSQDSTGVSPAHRHKSARHSGFLISPGWA